MAITQLSAFLENTPGTLYQAVSAISDAGINLRALSVADTRDFGILRMIVSDVSRTKEVLGEYTLAAETKVTRSWRKPPSISNMSMRSPQLSRAPLTS